MDSEKIICPNCNHSSGYSAVYCRCGHFLGFPNRRAAEEEAVDLDRRYKEAAEAASARGLDHLVGLLEALAEDSQPVICMSIEVADDLLRSAKYRNYRYLIDQGIRDPAEKENDSSRTMVGARLFPAYFQHIHYAALSPDGNGLTSYGDIAIRWQVTVDYLEKRISVHDENSFGFFDRHELGKRSAKIPKGYMGVWADRRKIALAKLAPGLSAAASEASLPARLLRSRTTRADDDFIEIAIFSADGIDTLDIDRVTVQNWPSDPERQRRLQLVEGSCAKRTPKVEFKA